MASGKAFNESFALRASPEIVLEVLEITKSGSSPKTLYNDVKCTRADSQGYNNEYFRDKQTRTFRVTKGGPFYSPLTHWHRP